MDITFTLAMDGSLIDRDASMLNFEEYLTNLCAEQEKEQEIISEAVSTVFDKNKGKRLPIYYVVSQALIAMGALPDNHIALYAKVDTYLRDHAGENKTFNIKRGSGIGRIADLVK